MFGLGRRKKSVGEEHNRLLDENRELRERLDMIKICRASEEQRDRLAVVRYTKRLQSQLGDVMMYCPQDRQWVIDRMSVMMSRELSEFFKPFR